MEEGSIAKAQKFTLASMSDLIRLVVSNAQNRGGYLYYGEMNGKHIYAISHLIPSWYNLRGLPVTLVAYGDEAPQHDFIAYKFSSEDQEESWEFVKNIKTSPKIAHIPIIRIESFPKFLL
ncbi:MAG: hypothetical protein FK732_00965 [Asgard group archaeon]|nr:hypothetical protein [Asgard group archaeon]